MLSAVSQAESVLSIFDVLHSTIDRPGTCTFPPALSKLVESYAANFFSDALHETPNNSALLEMAERYKTAQLTTLDLSGRVDLDNETLCKVVALFPTIFELDIRECRLAGFDLEHQTARTLYSATRMPNLSLMRLGGSGAHDLDLDEEAEWLMRRGVRIDLEQSTNNAPLYEGKGILGCTLAHPIPARIAAIMHTGSWSPRDIYTLVQQNNTALLQQVFESGKFEINSAIDALGNTVYTAACILHTSPQMMALILAQPNVNLEHTQRHPPEAQRPPLSSPTKFSLPQGS